MKKEKSRKMTPRRTQAITYLIASAPMLWWGGSQFEVGGHDKLMAIGLSLSLTFGMLFAICGVMMLFTKTKLGEKAVTQETAIRMAPQVEQTELFEIPAEPERTLSSEKIIKFRALGETVKHCNAERAEIRATLNSRGISINEDGNIEVK
jgi:hypothetical protein